MSCLCENLISSVEQNDEVLIRKVKNGALIVDARSKASFEKGHVKGAVSIPVGDRSAAQIDANIMLVESHLRFEYYNPNRDNSIIVYDEIGWAASHVVKGLKRAGFHNISNGGGFHRVATLVKVVHERDARLASVKQREEEKLKIEEANSHRYTKENKSLRLLSLNLAVVRAVDRFPKESLERFAAQNALMALPFFRKCDIGRFVDLVLDCCEEIECEEGTELTTQGSISEFLFIIIRGEVLRRESKDLKVKDEVMTEGSCLGTRSLIHLPEKYTTIVKKTPHKHFTFEKKSSDTNHTSTTKSVRLYCLHQNVYHKIRSFVSFDETIRRRKLLGKVEILRALGAKDLERLCWGMKLESFRRNEVVFIAETGDGGIPREHKNKVRGLDFGGDSSGSDEDFFQDKNDYLYIVETGKIEVRVGPGRGRFIGKLLPGDVFGEGGLLTRRRPRSRGCIAMGGSTGASALILNRSDLEMCFGVPLEDLLRERYLIERLQTVPIFSPLSDKQCEAIARAMSRRFYTNGEVLAEEFSEASEFILITDGVAKLISTPPPPKAQVSSNSSGDSSSSRGLKRYNSFFMQKTLKTTEWVAEPVVVGSLEAWEYFGERSLVYKGERRKVGLVACGEVEALVLDRHNFQRLIQTQLADDYAWQCVVEGEFHSIKKAETLLDENFSLNFKKDKQPQQIDNHMGMLSTSSLVHRSVDTGTLVFPDFARQPFRKNNERIPEKRRVIKEDMQRDEDGGFSDKRRLTSLLRMPLKSVTLNDLHIDKCSLLTELSGGFSDEMFAAVDKRLSQNRYLVRYCHKQNIINSGGGTRFADRLAIERRLLLGELRGLSGVVGCYGTFQTFACVVFLYEFMGGGTLSSVLRTMQALSSPDITAWLDSTANKVPQGQERSASWRKVPHEESAIPLLDIPGGLIDDIGSSYNPVDTKQEFFDTNCEGNGRCLELSKLGGMEEQDARFYVGSIVLALKAIHGRGIAHRDLRLSNIILSGNGYPKLFGFSRGKKFPYRASPAARVPPQMPQHASRAHFAKNSKVFDPVEIMAKQAFLKALQFAKMTGAQLPSAPGPARGEYQKEAETIGPQEAAKKLTLFYNNESLQEERAKEADLAGNDTSKSIAELSMAEKEVLQKEEKLRHEKSNVAPLLWKAYTLCGELEYSAPEMLLCTGHDMSVDNWALGCLMHELLTGRTPFAPSGSMELHEKILSTLTGGMKTGGREVAVDVQSYFSPGLSPQAVDLIAGLMKPQPEHRLGSRVKGWQEVMDHPWFLKGFHEEKRRSYHEMDTVRYQSSGGFSNDYSGADQVRVNGMYRGHGRFISWDALIHGEVKPPLIPRPHPAIEAAEDSKVMPTIDTSRYLVDNLDPEDDVPYNMEHRNAFLSF